MCEACLFCMLFVSLCHRWSFELLISIVYNNVNNCICGVDDDIVKVKRHNTYHKSHTATAAELCVIDQAGEQSRPQSKPALNGPAAIQPCTALICRLMISIQ